MKLHNPEVLTDDDFDSVHSPEGDWISLDLDNHGGAVLVVGKMCDGNYKDYYKQLMEMSQRPTEAEIRRKIVKEMRSYAFIHYCDNKEPILLAIEHGHDWPKHVGGDKA